MAKGREMDLWTELFDAEKMRRLIVTITDGEQINEVGDGFV